MSSPADDAPSARRTVIPVLLSALAGGMTLPMSVAMTDVLEESRNYWDRHARRDPLWAILSDAAKRDGRWDTTRFFDTGLSEISSILYELDSQGIALRTGAALDFGCGVGRLTQALAPHFDRVVGVDVSPAMLELAERLNQFPGKASYVCSTGSSLHAFEDDAFDLVVTSIVLQHVEPEIALVYLHEFFRVLSPAGIVVFQLPSHGRRRTERAPVSIVHPMPDTAYCASLVVTCVPRRTVTPGAEITLQVEITNLSAFAWSQREFGVMAVGNHWFDGAGGRLVIRDDGRTSLPGTLAPGATCRVPLLIKAPQDSGEYQCEVDVAHEGVLWFHGRGSRVVRFPVRVGGREDSDADVVGDEGGPIPDRGTSAAAPSDERSIEAPSAATADTNTEDPGAFPMYGIPLNVVVATIARCGGTLLHVDNDRSCGDDWVSYRYFVRK
jgi:SAM-dependent methyltransferase